MKWFQHQSNAHRDFNVEPFVDKFGLEGYGLYWICAEIIAEKGEGYQISEKQGWKRYLISRSRFVEGKVDEILLEMAELNLIDKKALEKGILYIPKMEKYSDDYTKKIQRVSGQGTDKVRTVSVPDKIRVNKSREDKKRKDKIILIPELEEIKKIILKYIPIRDIDNKTSQRYLKMFYNAAEKDIGRIESLCKGVEYFKKSEYPYTIYSVESLYKKKEKISARMEVEALKLKNKKPTWITL